MYISILAAILLSSPRIPTHQSPSQSRNVSKLIKQIRAAYNGCKSYRDTGTQTIWNIERGKRTLWGEWKFSTLFLRPGLLRLEASERGDNGKFKTPTVLWTVKQPGHPLKPSKDPLEPTPYPVSLYMGLDGSLHTGNPFFSAISSFSSLCFGIGDKVPLILFPSEVMADDLTQEDLKWAGWEKIRSHNCFVLSSKELGAKYWFDKRSNLLMRMQGTRDFGVGKSTLKQVEYSPSFNAPVSEREFKGPERKR